MRDERIMYLFRQCGNATQVKNEPAEVVIFKDYPPEDEIIKEMVDDYAEMGFRLDGTFILQRVDDSHGFPVCGLPFTVEGMTGDFTDEAWA